ncbi:MAG: integration host factor subunit beta [Candidatus Omnitrophica bacterium]|nr:integration host factor subunit beta [Candidatus Omnitrophota bacterium]MDD5430265.1 integration host factor subunit beta [Candidatus Omnitrophota bacterium]
MNKAQLVETIAARTATKKEAQEIVETIWDSIKSSLKKKEDVAISGFGTFKVKQTKARMGRNPKTGETIQIPAKKKVAFRASKDLKAILA